MHQFAAVTVACRASANSQAGETPGGPLGKTLVASHRCHLVSTHTRRWGGIVATVLRFEAHRRSAEVSCAADIQRLIALVQSTGGGASLNLGFDSESDVEEVSNAVLGQGPMMGRSPATGYFSHLAIGGGERGPGNHIISNQRIMDMCHLLAAELRDHDPNDLLYGESHGRALRALLARPEVVAQTISLRCQLSPWRKHRVRGHLEENLSRNIPVTELADMIGLSRSHFSRAFKVSFGATPHKWVLLARVERSKALLIAGGRSIADIALEVGFLDQPHFTRTFTRLAGMSPMTWLRQARADFDETPNNRGSSVDCPSVTPVQVRADGHAQ